MKKFVDGLILFMLLFFCFQIGVSTPSKEEYELKRTCELDLPSNQECIIAFIAPDEAVVKRSTIKVGNGTTN